MGEKGKKLYHWCPTCKQIVAKKKTEVFGFPVSCRHDPDSWVKMYMTESQESAAISVKAPAPDPSDALAKLMQRLNQIARTPYLDQRGARDVAAKFENFVNRSNVDDMINAAFELATDAQVMEYMVANGFTFAENEEDAVARTIITIGEELATMHRTLQQSFMRVVLTFIEIEATFYKAGVYDARNEDTGRLCAVLWDAIKDREDLYLRYI